MNDEAKSAGAERRTSSSHSPATSHSASTRRGEFQFIRSLRDRASSRRRSTSAGASSSLVNGIGDDAAVIRETSGRETLVSADLLVEDIDFDRATTTARLLGHKALAVSLSDIAAMGGRPSFSLLSLGIPSDIWNSDLLDEFYEGFFALADRYGVVLAGGDLSRTPEKIVIDSMAMGQCASGGAILRRGARAGDHLFVTGSLGGSAAGLRLLQRGARVQTAELPVHNGEPDSHSVRQLLLRHLRPEPRVGWGLVLGEEQLASALIDISDGLSSDLHHLCQESGVGALIYAADIPIDPTVTEICGRRALDPLLLALNGGEDFELLFTVPSEKVAGLPKTVDGVSITLIGRITGEPGKVCVAEKDHIWNLRPKGFEHFKS